MHSYELTERGKIVIAIILVVLILVLPAMILAYKAWAQPAQPPDNNDSGGSGAFLPAPADTPSLITAESPPPNGGGFNPPDIFSPVDDGNPGGESLTSTPVSGQPSVDVNKGTLSFFFSPGQQDALDVVTASLLGTFLGSSKNTADSLITVEIPELPDEKSNDIITAVINAFAAFGVTEQKLTFMTISADITKDAFQVNLSFITQRAK